MIVKSPTVVDCTHCGLGVPPGLLDSTRTEQFCCAGCKGAYQLIEASGLGSFYKMQDAGISVPVEFESESSKGNYFEYDEPVFLNKYSKQLDSDRRKIELAIDGMHCVACIWLIEKLPTILPGVLEARVNWGRRTVQVIWSDSSVSLSKIATSLAKLGYLPFPLQPNSKLQRWELENRRHLIRIGVAAACAGNNMVISAALYFAMFSHMTAGMTQLMRVASGLVGLVALCGPGRVFVTSALAAVKTRTPHMDLPIALALIVGTLAGVTNVIRGAGDIYFDTLCVLIVLLLIGRWLQFRQQTKAASAVELLSQLTPQKTRKFVEGRLVECLVDSVEVGDLLQIRQGEIFPVDGVVMDSGTEADESILTGESVPVGKAHGDEVLAGTTNVGAVVLMKGCKVRGDTRIHQLAGLVEQATDQRPQIVQWSNRVGGYFVMVVLFLASLSMAWWGAFDFELGLDRSIALLIVACPCALALATPLAIAVALGKAAKEKIMVKGGDVLQSLQNPGTLWLDKTGTVTDGHLRVVRWFGDTDWLYQITTLERCFTHPIARAINNFGIETLSKKSLDRFQLNTEVSETVNHSGMGVSGTIGSNRIAIGNESLVEQAGVSILDKHRRVARRITERGSSPCWIAINGEVVGIAELRDSIRPEASDAINELKRRGWRVGILSGDHQDVVDRVATSLGIKAELALGGVTPEEKLATVKRDEGTVVMVGDGVNDSAALAAATVGIAVKGSAEASLTAAPVYLAKKGLKPVLELLDLSKSTANVLRINLGVSLAYNVTFAALAFSGFINPLAAAILMPISSITVVAISMASGRKYFKVHDAERPLPS
ncbi:MAG: cadmium-translocating P-type ATPase [Planctomycetaceae bacterium]|nr:cadmium-translocating P-type ATPase [Planctomycetaceae bacterium]